MGLRHHFLIRQLRARPRLWLCCVAGVLVGFLLPHTLSSAAITRAIIAWNVTTCLYLVLGGIMMMRATPEQIRVRACIQDEGQWLILLLVVLASVASVSAIIAELSIAKELSGATKFVHIGLAGFTIFSSWAFTHMMFALHYAHDYYVECTHRRTPGLQFPGDEPPSYGDFLYFSFVIGTSGQTADVNFTTGAMRRIGLLHCVLAFFFNTPILALTINIAAGLF